jgi:hypothetical protein
VCDYLFSAITQFIAAWSEGKIVEFVNLYQASMNEATSTTHFYIGLNCWCIIITRSCLSLNEIYFSYQYVICYFQIKHMV